MSETRGIHPETGLQRKRRGSAWAQPHSQGEVEMQDAPYAAIGKGLGWIAAGLIVAIALVLASTRLALPRPSLGANAAHGRFRTAGPPLLPVPAAALHQAQVRHPAPAGDRLDKAMNQVLEQGWDDSSPAPGRAEVAAARARQRQ